MVEEHWRKIGGTCGLLEVSDKGRVRSLMRDGRILKAQPDKKGYMRISATVKRQKRTLKVHREVAKSFVPNPNDLPQVNHIDGNKKNNDASNLEWVSNEENVKHAVKTGLWEKVFEASRAENERRKTPIYSVDEETGRIIHFGSVSEAERYFGTRHISDVLNGKRERASGQRFFREVVE